METEKIIHVVAGILILVSVLLSVVFSAFWLIVTGIVGLNLLIDGITGFCTARKIINKLRT